MRKFPKTLYIKCENEGTDDAFFACDIIFETYAEIGEEIPVAIYELKEIRTLVTRGELVSKVKK
mgnify:CR=1 FL=1